MDAIVCMVGWLLVVLCGFVLLAYFEWRDKIEAVLRERERRRAAWHFWWYEDKDGLTKKPARQYHQGSARSAKGAQEW